MTVEAAGLGEEVPEHLPQILLPRIFVLYSFEEYLTLSK